MTNATQNPTQGLGRAAVRRADRAIKKAALAELIQDNDLQFTYLRKLDAHTGDCLPHGGMVIAYKVPRGGGNVVEVSTALCSNKDIFDKLEGRFMAANNFASGAKIKIQLKLASHWGQQLQEMFCHPE